MKWAPVIALLCAPTLAMAQPGGGSRSEAPDPARLERAKKFFRQGNALRRAGDCEGALPLYQQSRDELPSISNTLNAALCLDDLERDDEAFALYELLLTKFEGRLTEADHQRIAPLLEKLLRTLGSIEVIANVSGTLVVDGRPRGKLPRLHGVRVMPGQRIVRVIKEGYQTFEATVQVTSRAVTIVDAKLQPLARGGTLQVSEPAGAEILIDGASVGVAPWSGRLAAGAHLMQVRRADHGSPLRRIAIVENQTVKAPPAPLSPLGPERRILLEPFGAQLSIDGIAVGAGRWVGRLPIGPHELIAREEGYFTAHRTLSIDATDASDTTVMLEIDRDHARWAVSERGHFWIDGLVGVAIAPGFSSGAEERCRNCGTAVIGGVTGIRAGYEIPLGVSVELMGGYMSLHKTLRRSVEETIASKASGNTALVKYQLDDELRLAGPFVGAGVSFRTVIAEPLELRSHLLAGALFASARDAIVGEATVDGQSANVFAVGSGDSVTAADLFVMPELGLTLRITDHWHANLGAALGFFVLEGPSYPSDDGAGELRLVDESHCSTDAPTAVTCLSASGAVLNERAYGTFAILLPNASIGALF